MNHFIEYFKIAFPIILSAAALGVSIFDYFLKKPKIDCRIDDIYDSYWIHGDKLILKDSSHNTEALVSYCDVIVMSLLIINKKSIPISIIDIYKGDALADHYLKFAQPIVNISMTNSIGDMRDTKISVIESPKATFPYRMSGYDVFRTSIAFLVDKSNEKNRTYKLTIKSPYKNYDFDLTVQSVDEHILHKKIGVITSTLNKAIEQYTNDRSNKSNNANSN